MQELTPSVQPDAAALTRLVELGVPVDPLRDALHQAWSRYAAECTPHDVKTAVGVLMWSKGTRFLRDRLVPLGWTPNHARNLERVISPDGALCIVIAQGTDATGLDRPVRTRYRRGPVMKEAITNRQHHFSEVAPEEFPRTEAAAPDPWVLLYYIDRQAGEIRIEFSLADGMDDDGYVTEWKERIVVGTVAIASEADAPESAPEGGGPYDVPVKPRKG